MKKYTSFLKERKGMWIGIVKDKKAIETMINTMKNGYETYYAHCNTMKVKKGDQVYKGQVIATVGKTGRVTGANLHFETRKNGISINPLKYVKY